VGGVLGALGRTVPVLGLNAVPLLGLFVGGWSTGTAVALYWIETALTIPFVSARILLHRRLTRTAGHYGVQTEARSRLGGTLRVTRGTTTHLAAFLSVMVPFVLVHGIFMAFLVFLILPREGGPAAAVALADLRRGAAAVGSFMAAGLLIDLVGIGRRPFRWIERITALAQGRVLVVHLTILLGLFALAITGLPTALFVIFAGLKTLVDLGGIWPERDSPEPPALASWLDRVIPSKPGETFVDYWRRSEAARKGRLEANERVVDRR
jgi:hypothetical protein